MENSNTTQDEKCPYCKHVMIRVLSPDKAWVCVCGCRVGIDL